MKEFYTLNELEQLKLTKLKRRALTIRINKLLATGTIKFGTNLFKIGNYWQIHNSLIVHFQHTRIKTQNLDLHSTKG